MHSRDTDPLKIFPLTEDDKKHADWFVALSTIGLFATPESARSARQDRNNIAERHRAHRAEKLAVELRSPLPSLQYSLLKHDQIDIAPEEKERGITIADPHLHHYEIPAATPHQESLLQGFVGFSR